MKKILILCFAGFLSLAFSLSPDFADARGHGGRGGGKGGGGHHGSHHGHHGHYGHFGHHGGFRYWGPAVGFGAGFFSGYYVAPWTYPAYYPEYYYAPPGPNGLPTGDEVPPPEFFEPPGAAQYPGSADMNAPEAPGQAASNSRERRCQRWSPTGQFHQESRWNANSQRMERVTVPEFSWQEIPCDQIAPEPKER